jgi:hypothetical protein
VAVIAFEPEAPSSWVRLKAADWLAALAGSEVLRTAGYQVVGLRSVAELTTALEAAPGQRPMAIVNPGGECYYAESLAGWEAMLDRIGRYVRGGGIWWETGGYSFYVCAAPRLDATGQVQGWESRPTGPAGAAKLGFSVAGYDVEDPPETLVLTETGRQWLGPERARRLESAATGVQRSFAEGEVDLVLAGSPRDDWLAATRGGGWGWLWRLGGFNPVPDAATDAVVGTIEYLATHPWPTPAVSRSRSLWRVEVRR